MPRLDEIVSVITTDENTKAKLTAALISVLKNDTNRRIETLLSYLWAYATKNETEIKKLKTYVPYLASADIDLEGLLAGLRKASAEDEAHLKKALLDACDKARVEFLTWQQSYAITQRALRQIQLSNEEILAISTVVRRVFYLNNDMDTLTSFGFSYNPVHDRIIECINKNYKDLSVLENSLDVFAKEYTGEHKKENERVLSQNQTVGQLLQRKDNPNTLLEQHLHDKDIEDILNYLLGPVDGWVPGTNINILKAVKKGDIVISPEIELEAGIGKAKDKKTDATFIMPENRGNYHWTAKVYQYTYDDERRYRYKKYDSMSDDQSGSFACGDWSSVFILKYVMEQFKDVEKTLPNNNGQKEFREQYIAILDASRKDKNNKDGKLNQRKLKRSYELRRLSLLILAKIKEVNLESPIILPDSTDSAEAPVVLKSIIAPSVTWDVTLESKTMPVEETPVVVKHPDKEANRNAFYDRVLQIMSAYNTQNKDRKLSANNVLAELAEFAKYKISEQEFYNHVCNLLGKITHRNSTLRYLLSQIIEFCIQQFNFNCEESEKKAVIAILNKHKKIVLKTTSSTLFNSEELTTIQSLNTKIINSQKPAEVPDDFALLPEKASSQQSVFIHRREQLGKVQSWFSSSQVKHTLEVTTSVEHQKFVIDLGKETTHIPHLLLTPELRKNNEKQLDILRKVEQGTSGYKEASIKNKWLKDELQAHADMYKFTNPTTTKKSELEINEMHQVRADAHLASVAAINDIRLGHKDDETGADEYATYTSKMQRALTAVKQEVDTHLVVDTGFAFDYDFIFLYDIETNINEQRFLRYVSGYIRIDEITSRHSVNPKLLDQVVEKVISPASTFAMYIERIKWLEGLTEKHANKPIDIAFIRAVQQKIIDGVQQAIHDLEKGESKHQETIRHEYANNIVQTVKKSYANCKEQYQNIEKTRQDIKANEKAKKSTHLDASTITANKQQFINFVKFIEHYLLEFKLNNQCGELVKDYLSRVPEDERGRSVAIEAILTALPITSVVEIKQFHYYLLAQHKINGRPANKDVFDAIRLLMQPRDFKLSEDIAFDALLRINEALPTAKQDEYLTRLKTKILDSYPQDGQQQDPQVAQLLLQITNAKKLSDLRKLPSIVEFFQNEALEDAVEILLHEDVNRSFLCTINQQKVEVTPAALTLLTSATALKQYEENDRSWKKFVDEGQRQLIQQLIQLKLSLGEVIDALKETKEKNNIVTAFLKRVECIHSHLVDCLDRDDWDNLNAIFDNQADIKSLLKENSNDSTIISAVLSFGIEQKEVLKALQESSYYLQQEAMTTSEIQKIKLYHIKLQVLHAVNMAFSEVKQTVKDNKVDLEVMATIEELCDSLMKDRISVEKLHKHIDNVISNQRQSLSPLLTTKLKDLRSLFETKYLECNVIINDKSATREALKSTTQVHELEYVRELEEIKRVQESIKRYFSSLPHIGFDNIDIVHKKLSELQELEQKWVNFYKNSSEIFQKRISLGIPDALEDAKKIQDICFEQLAQCRALFEKVDLAVQEYNKHLPKKVTGLVEASEALTWEIIKVGPTSVGTSGKLTHKRDSILNTLKNTSQDLFIQNEYPVILQLIRGVTSYAASKSLNVSRAKDVNSILKLAHSLIEPECDDDVRANRLKTLLEELISIKGKIEKEYKIRKPTNSKLYVIVTEALDSLQRNHAKMFEKAFKSTDKSIILVPVEKVKNPGLVYGDNLSIATPKANKKGAVAGVSALKVVDEYLTDPSSPSATLPLSPTGMQRLDNYAAEFISAAEKKNKNTTVAELKSKLTVSTNFIETLNKILEGKSVRLDGSDYNKNNIRALIQRLQIVTDGKDLQALFNLFKSDLLLVFQQAVQNGELESLNKVVDKLILQYLDKCIESHCISDLVLLDGLLAVIKNNQYVAERVNTNSDITKRINQILADAYLFKNQELMQIGKVYSNEQNQKFIDFVCLIDNPFIILAGKPYPLDDNENAKSALFSAFLSYLHYLSQCNDLNMLQTAYTFIHTNIKHIEKLVSVQDTKTIKQFIEQYIKISLDNNALKNFSAWQENGLLDFHNEAICKGNEFYAEVQNYFLTSSAASDNDKFNNIVKVLPEFPRFMMEQAFSWRTAELILNSTAVDDKTRNEMYLRVFDHFDELVVEGNKNPLDENTLLENMNVDFTIFIKRPRNKTTEKFWKDYSAKLIFESPQLTKRIKLIVNVFGSNSDQTYYASVVESRSMQVKNQHEANVALKQFADELIYRDGCVNHCFLPSDLEDATVTIGKLTEDNLLRCDDETKKYVETRLIIFFKSVDRDLQNLMDDYQHLPLKPRFVMIGDYLKALPMIIRAYLSVAMQLSPASVSEISTILNYANNYAKTVILPNLNESSTLFRGNNIKDNQYNLDSPEKRAVNERLILQSCLIYQAVNLNSTQVNDRLKNLRHAYINHAVGLDRHSGVFRLNAFEQFAEYSELFPAMKGLNTAKFQTNTRHKNDEFRQLCIELYVREIIRKEDILQLHEYVKNKLTPTKDSISTEEEIDLIVESQFLTEFILSKQNVLIALMIDSIARNCLFTPVTQSTFDTAKLINDKLKKCINCANSKENIDFIKKMREIINALNDSPEKLQAIKLHLPNAGLFLTQHQQNEIHQLINNAKQNNHNSWALSMLDKLSKVCDNALTLRSNGDQSKQLVAVQKVNQFNAQAPDIKKYSLEAQHLVRESDYAAIERELHTNIQKYFGYAPVVIDKLPPSDLWCLTNKDLVPQEQLKHFKHNSNEQKKYIIACFMQTRLIAMSVTINGSNKGVNKVILQITHLIQFKYLLEAQIQYMRDNKIESREFLKYLNQALACCKKTLISKFKLPTLSQQEWFKPTFALLKLENAIENQPLTVNPNCFQDANISAALKACLSVAWDAYTSDQQEVLKRQFVSMRNFNRANPKDLQSLMPNPLNETAVAVLGQDRELCYNLFLEKVSIEVLPVLLECLTTYPPEDASERTKIFNALNKDEFNQNPVVLELLDKVKPTAQMALVK